MRRGPVVVMAPLVLVAAAGIAAPSKETVGQAASNAHLIALGTQVAHLGDDIANLKRRIGSQRNGPTVRERGRVGPGFTI